MFKKIILVISVVFLFIAPCISAQSELKPRISVFPLENPAKDVQIDIISRNVQKTIELNLKMIDKYIIVGHTVAEYSSEKSWLIDYCEKNSIDDIIFGRAIIEEGGSVFLEMSVFNRQSASITMTKTETAETFFDIFDSSDILAVNMMEGFSGMHLGFGTLKFNNKGESGKYSVYIDEALAGDTIANLPTVLNGERSIKITQNRMFEELVVFDGKVLVLEKKTADVDFSIPGFIEAESAALDKQENYIDKYWQNKYASKKVDKRFDKLLELLATTDYSASAAEKRKDIDEKLAAWQKKKEEWGLTTGLSLLDRKGSASIFAGMAIMSPDYEQEGSPGWEPVISVNPKLGASLSYNITNSFAIQPEITFSHVWADIENENILMQQGAEFDLLEFPVLFLYRLPGKVMSIYGATIYQLRTSEGFVYTEDMATGSYYEMMNEDNKYIERSGFALGGGIQVEIPLNKNFMKFDFRYVRSLTSWIVDNNDDNSMYLDYFHMTFGYGIKFF